MLTDASWHVHFSSIKKFKAENHLKVHKKRHEMDLSPGLDAKTVLADQTPTPTQFFKNCEEVGLFQDLQNVNPFEETFKKAVEAVKSGQPLEKPPSNNMPDDSLHTPNVFLHITDIPSAIQNGNSSKSENIAPSKNSSNNIQKASNMKRTKEAKKRGVKGSGSGRGNRKKMKFSDTPSMLVPNLHKTILAENQLGVPVQNSMTLDGKTPLASKVIFIVPNQQNIGMKPQNIVAAKVTMPKNQNQLNVKKTRESKKKDSKKVTPSKRNSTKKKGKSSESVISTSTSFQFPGAIVSENKSAIPGKNAVALNPKTSLDSKFVLNVPKDQIVRLLTTDNLQPPCNVVLLKNSANTVHAMSAKEKLKKSLSDKKSSKQLQLKVPISKYPIRKNNNTLSSKFSKFSKNAMKLISKLENSESANSDKSVVPSKRQRNTIERFHTKEARSEFLARSRAASFRCREKKKMYVLYLEKVNTELSAANQNLHLTNMSLQKQLRELHTELLKHKSCNAADKDTVEILSKIEKTITDDSKFSGEKKKMPEKLQFLTVFSNPVLRAEPPVISTSMAVATVEKTEPDFPQVEDVQSFVMESDPCNLDVAEITIDEQCREDEIPLEECIKTPGIITRFNSVSSDCPTEFPPHSYSSLIAEKMSSDIKRIHGEHSYFQKKNFLNVDQQLSKFKNFYGTALASSGPNAKVETDPKAKSSLKNLTGMTKVVHVDHKTPPPLILLKPFKKRTLPKKKSEKT